MKLPSLLIPDLPFNSLVALDLSGSRNIDPNYLFSLLERFMVRQVVIFTTQIDGVLNREDLATPEKLKGALQKLVGMGGTDVQPVVDYFLKKRFDHLVVITDGELVVPQVNKDKITWVIDEVGDWNRDQDFSYLPGKVMVGV